MKISTTRLASSAAFTLVEVALAMGLASFCLVAVLGLVPLGVDTSQVASDQAAASSILTHVLADLRTTPATLPSGDIPTSSQYTLPIPLNPVPGDTTVVRYFGTSPQQFSLSPSAPGSRYRLTATFLRTDSADGVKAATKVTLLVSWPPSVDPAKPSTGIPAGRVQIFAALDRN